MSDEAIEAATAFLVVVSRQGSMSVYAENIPAIAVDRIATLADVETYASQAARDAGRLITQQMQEPTSPESPSQAVSRALQKRSEES